MTNLLGYLGMDVAAMSVHDWIGVFFSLVAFIGMAVVYVMVLRPANKGMFEAQRSMAMDDEVISISEKKDERKTR